MFISIAEANWILAIIRLENLKVSNVESLLDVDISNCENLQSLIIDTENLHNLNASVCSSLKSFIYQNRNYYGDLKKWNLTSLNMSKCTSLTSLSCDFNKIKELDISGCTALITLSVYFNNLEALDAHTCLALNNLYTFGNSDLKTLTLNKNHQITTLCKDDHTEIVLLD